MVRGRSVCALAPGEIDFTAKAPLTPEVSDDGIPDPATHAATTFCYAHTIRRVLRTTKMKVRGEIAMREGSNILFLQNAMQCRPDLLGAKARR